MCQKTFRVMTTSNPHRHTKKRLIKTVGAHTLCSCGYMQDGGCVFTSRTIRAMCAWCSIKECLIVKVMKYKILKKQ